jgi:predicted P-loop ATPase/GTPase
MFTQAYSPEQAAFGKLENGREVLILYIKEFNEQVKAVNQSGLSRFTYHWFTTEQKDAYVLQVTWENELHIAIRFNPQHFDLIQQLLQPKDVILSTTPISELMENAQKSNYNFLEFNEVLTFSNLSFAVPYAEYLS